MMLPAGRLAMRVSYPRRSTRFPASTGGWALLNVLFITADQWRGDCLSALGHPCVRTPHLDGLAESGVLFTRHYSQASPCSPGRASLYTGLYLHNHRVVVNGTPLDARHTNVALEARRLGYDPVLFGYTDTSVDPRSRAPGDPALRTYAGVLPGMTPGGADGRRPLALAKASRAPRLRSTGRPRVAVRTGARRSRPGPGNRRRRDALAGRGRSRRLPHRQGAGAPEREGAAAVVRARLLPGAASSVHRVRALERDVRSRRRAATGAGAHAGRRRYASIPGSPGTSETSADRASPSTTTRAGTSRSATATFARRAPTTMR